MKKISSFVKLLLAAAVVSTAFIEISAAPTRTQMIVAAGTSGANQKLRTAPIICMTDKEAGYTELQFRMDIGEACVTVTDSNGYVVGEETVDTAIVKSVIINLPDPDDTYTVKVDGEVCSAEGIID